MLIAKNVFIAIEYVIFALNRGWVSKNNFMASYNVSQLIFKAV